MYNPYKDSGSNKMPTHGHLPHWNQDWKYQFITFRLGDSIPVNKARNYLMERQDWMSIHPKPWDLHTQLEYENLYDARIEKYLHLGYGSCVLRNIHAAQILAGKLHGYDGIYYNLVAYVVMPNHVHVLIRTFDMQLGEIEKKWKGGSALLINRYLSRKGSLWQRECFDTMIRDQEHFNHVTNYIYRNYTSGGVCYWTAPDF